jgi:glycosyltransferase involved in cell wall biosynthesis
MIDYMMASKPVIQAIKAGNNMVEEAGCGIAVEPENPEKLAEAIVTIKKLPLIEKETLGKNGKEYAIANHDYKILSKRFEEIMLKLLEK